MIAAIVCGVAVVGLLWAERADHALGRAVTKTIASTAFVAAALASGALTHGTGIAIFVALVLSAIGDLCLLSRERVWFLAGLGAFLLGHLAFAVAFCIARVDPIATLVATVPLGIGATYVWMWLEPRVGTMGTPVRAYILVISAMVALAVGAAVKDPTPERLGLALAAALFFASDLCVARDRFVAPGPANRMIGLPLYYGAQVLFALLA